MKKIRLFLLSLIVFVGALTFNGGKVVIEKKDYKAANTNEVSTRELAMLASLVYEDVPNDSNYSPKSKSAGIGCNVDSEGNVKGKNDSKCFWVAYEEKTNSSIKRDKYHVYQYIEGLSERKVNLRPVSMLTAAFKEDGEKYYFLNFAKTSELAGKWEIVHFASDDTLPRDPIIGKLAKVLPDKATFDAITFKKGDNYVIAFRGTDYPDLFEWGEDILYAADGEHIQAYDAYLYAKAEYNRIVEKNKNAKIYVVGHSLGAYLAQVGGAAIIDTVSGRADPYITPASNLSELSNYDSVYRPASNLVQVAYFNGMGVGGLFKESNFTRNIDNALVYLSTHNVDGSLANSGRSVNYSNSVASSGRLVLYSIDADPVSDIGLHYGEIYKLDVGADAVSNHNGTHTSILGVALEQILKNGNIGNVSQQIANLINTSSITKLLTPEKQFIPTFVANKIKEANGGRDIRKYSLASILTNLDNDIKSFNTKYGKYGAMIDNLFDHFNMNHETDSFNCIIDKTNGKLNSKNLIVTVDSNYMSCSNGRCLSKYAYSMPHTYLLNNGKLKKKEYSLGNIINKTALYDYNISNFIMLTANISGGCVKTYNWEYSNDGNNYTALGTTVNKKIIIPKSVINTSNNSSKTVYFRVKLNYGDNFYEAKSKLENGVVKYVKSNSSTRYNPTNSEDRTLGNTSGVITSAPVAVTFVYDNKAPDCKFDPKSKTIKRGQSTTIQFKCNDASAVKFNASKFKLSFNILRDGFSFSAKCYNEKKYCDITIKASSNKYLTSDVQQILYNDKISDANGNTTSTVVKSVITLTRKK